MYESRASMITIMNLKNGACVDKQLPVTLKAVTGIIIENYLFHWDIENQMILNKIVPASNEVGVDLQFSGILKLINIPGRQNKMQA